MAIYNKFKQKIADGSIDLDTDDIRCALATSAYTPDIDADTTYGALGANEVSATNGYTAGGEQVTSLALTVDTTNDKATLDGSDITWANSTITARYAVVYQSVAGTSDWLVQYHDFGSDKSSEGNDFTVQWSTAGIMDLS